MTTQSQQETILQTVLEGPGTAGVSACLARVGRTRLRYAV